MTSRFVVFWMTRKTKFCIKLSHRYENVDIYSITKKHCNSIDSNNNLILVIYFRQFYEQQKNKQNEWNHLKIYDKFYVSLSYYCTNVSHVNVNCK